MNMIGTLSLPYFILAFILRRKAFHQMLVRMFLVFSIPTILFAEMFFEWVMIHPSLWTRSQMIYEHKTFKIDSIIETYDEVRMIRGIEDHKNTKVFDEGIESLDRYIKTYGNTLDRTQVYDASLVVLDEFIGMRVLNDAARERIYSGNWKVDSVLIKMLFTAAEKMIKIDSVLGRYGFTTIETQADLYHIFHQPEKEKAFLEKMLRLEKDEIVQREVKKRLAELNAKNIR